MVSHLFSCDFLDLFFASGFWPFDCNVPGCGSFFVLASSMFLIEMFNLLLDFWAIISPSVFPVSFSLLVSLLLGYPWCCLTRIWVSVSFFFICFLFSLSVFLSVAQTEKIMSILFSGSLIFFFFSASKITLGTFSFQLFYFLSWKIYLVIITIPISLLTHSIY